MNHRHVISLNAFKDAAMLLAIIVLAFRSCDSGVTPQGSFKTDTLTVTTTSSLAASTASTLHATGATDLDTTLNVDGNTTLQADLTANNGLSTFWRTRQSSTRFDSFINKTLAAGTNNNVDCGAGQVGANRINFTSDAGGSTMTGMYGYVGQGELYVVTNSGGQLTIADDSGSSDAGNRFQLGTATVVFEDGDSWVQWWDGVYWHIAGVH